VQTFIYQFVVLDKINRLTLKRFEQKYLLLCGFTFEVVQISPASTLYRIGPTGMNETLYSWTFKFHKVVRQQNSGVVEDFILSYSPVYLRIQKWKNYLNRSTFAKVIVKIIVAPFLMAHGVYSVYGVYGVQQFLCWQCGSIFICLAVVASQTCQLPVAQHSQKIWTYSSSRSSKVDDFGTNRKRIYEFLLVINSNFGPILHRFWDTATYLLKIAYFSYPSPIRRPAPYVPFGISRWS